MLSESAQDQGQKRAVKVCRYVTKGSIEEEIDERSVPLLMWDRADAVHRQVEKKELAMSVYGCDEKQFCGDTAGA